MYLEKTKYVCMGEGKEILKFDGGKEIKPYTECTYLGTKIDQLGDNTTEIKHRISQTRKVINSFPPFLQTMDKRLRFQNSTKMT